MGGGGNCQGVGVERKFSDGPDNYLSYLIVLLISGYSLVNSLQFGLYLGLGRRRSARFFFDGRKGDRSN